MTSYKELTKPFMRQPNQPISSIHLKNHGLTLTELLVASVMIGIIMIGIASFGTSIQQLQSSTNRSVILAMRAKAVMARLAEDAYEAVGSAGDPNGPTNIGPGIRVGGSGPNKGLCFRHDVANTPDSYGDDEWTCYFQAPGPIPTLYLCGAPPTPEAKVPVKNNGDCQTNAPGGQKQMLLPLRDNAADTFYEVVNDGSGRFQYITLTLRTIYDHTVPAHPVTNPEYVLSTDVSPPGHSR